MDWQPGASWAALRQRAAWLTTLRQFFAERQILEVETPILARAATTEVNLHSFVTYDGDRAYYLPTSPEFFMKRLLAAGSGDIYQIARAFRREERGARHAPEFTLVEWYRVGFNDGQLMDEVAELVKCLLADPTLTVSRIRYAEAFQHYLQLNIFTADITDLKHCGIAHDLIPPRHLPLDELDPWRDWLLTHLIEPHLGNSGLCFLYDYPASQAALARLTPGDPSTAARFELYWRGLELANGFWELTDPAEQHRRFLADNQRRRRENLPEMPIDQALLAALASGLPDCAGVALGLDRLLMQACQATHLGAVIAFGTEWAE